jgi:DnaK suppressor protein
MIRKKTYLPAEFIRKIKGYLISEERRLKREEKRLKEEDPFLVPGRDVDNPELMEEAEEKISHERVEAERGIVQKFLLEIRLALSKLKIGKYGVCEQCGKRIDRARLEALPHARYCLRCENELKGSGTP